jgi:hypothetical protein
VIEDGAVVVDQVFGARAAAVVTQLVAHHGRNINNGLVADLV